MSDGPYRSLPMSRWWKRLAQYCENENFQSADVSAAAVEALEWTCRSGLPSKVIEGLRSIFLEQQAALFSDRLVESVEALSPLTAGHAIGQLLLDHAICVLYEGGRGESGLTDAAERMLAAVSERASRQIEEHYVRAIPTSLTRRRIVGRAGQALKTADTRPLARRLCGLEPGARPRSSRKYSGIDDGVPL